MRLLRFLLLALALAAPFAAEAVEPDEMLADPALEARARAISAGLRCMVCQNESIDDSKATLAHDIRVLVRQRLKEGDSDDAIRRFLVTRYGDFILLKPPFKLDTLLLWGTPGLLLLGGGLALLMAGRRRGSLAMPTALSPDEQVALEAVLAKDSVQPQRPRA